MLSSEQMPEKQKCELGDQQMDVETNPEGRVDGCLDQNPVAVEDSGSVNTAKRFLDPRNHMHV